MEKIEGFESIDVPKAPPGIDCVMVDTDPAHRKVSLVVVLPEHTDFFEKLSGLSRDEALRLVKDLMKKAIPSDWI